MTMTQRRPGLLLLLFAFGCVDWNGPDTGPLSFAEDFADLGAGRSVATAVTNNSDVPYGPIGLRATSVTDTGANPVAGATVVIVPGQIATLNPGASQNIAITVTTPPALPDGEYAFDVIGQVPELGDALSLSVRFSSDGVAATSRVVTVTITGAPTSARQGDMIRLGSTARDAAGQVVNSAIIAWSVQPSGAGYIDGTGTFVGYQSGPVTILAAAGTGNATRVINVSPRGLTGSFTTVGRGSVTARFTSDLWAFGSTVYTGTWGVRAAANGALFGNRMYAWEAAPGGPLTLRDSVSLNARTVNDVKIRDDGRLAVVTHEGSNDGLNGVTFLDTTDPFHPVAITRFTSTLTTGVHNAWLDGNYAYLVVDGTGPSSGLRVLDVTVPSAPAEVASFYGGSSFLHDVYVRDGLAFLSHWDAGLIILDAGNGIEGGSPGNPVEVSRIEVSGGQTHNAWYWPAAKYVFVGEEDFGTPGIMHVIDVSDLHRPREVATMSVPGTTPHNFWLDESTGILYLAWYSNGVRAVDVTGLLAGQLERQGREYAGIQYAGTGPGCSGPINTHTCNWAPQFHNGLLYLSDMNTGLWVLQPTP